MVDLATDLRRIGIIQADHAKAALLEALVLRKRGADLPYADDDHAPVALEAEDATHALRELRHLVAEPALAEGAEEGKVFPNLRGGRAAASGQLFAGYRREPRRLEFLEEAQIERQATNGRIGDSLQWRGGL